MEKKPKLITSRDVQDFAVDFKNVCEGQPRSHYPVLLRELILQRCHVAAKSHKTFVLGVQAIVRQICLPIFAFQVPLVSVMSAKNAVTALKDAYLKALFITHAGGHAALETVDVCLLEEDQHDVASVDWTYVDKLSNSQIMLTSLCDGSELVTILLALTLSECGRRSNVIIVKGRKLDAKKRLLVFPPYDAEDWFYNTGDRTHFWIEGVSKPKETMWIDGACFEYQPDRTSVYMWSHADSNYVVETKYMCTRSFAMEMLARLAELLSGLNYDFMEKWSTTMTKFV